MRIKELIMRIKYMNYLISPTYLKGNLEDRLREVNITSYVVFGSERVIKKRNFTAEKLTKKIILAFFPNKARQKFGIYTAV